MELISDTVDVGGPKGPAHAKVYAAPPPVNLWDPADFVKGPPLDAFAAMRKAAPIAWQEEPEDRPGFWAVTRYDDVMRINGDPATFSSQRGGILMGASGRTCSWPRPRWTP